MTDKTLREYLVKALILAAPEDERSRRWNKIAGEILDRWDELIAAESAQSSSPPP